MERDEARRRLERLRGDFRATVEELRERLAHSQRESGGDVAIVDQHPADAASETAERDDVSRAAMFEARLRQRDDAFERLAQGTYGRCLICGEKIPNERLALVPDTPFCVKDAQREQARAQ